jgi:uncharacterized protein
MGSVAGKFPVQPIPTPWSEGYWSALSNHQLAIQACAACGRLEHPPTVCCPDCGSFERTWQPVSGLGTVYSYIICHHSTHRALNDLVPYNVATIDLDEGVRMVSSIVSDNDDDARSLNGAIGRRVRVDYVDGLDCVLPVFRFIS